MRIQLLSDLHLEFLPVKDRLRLLEQVTANQAPDLTILAGDVAPLDLLAYEHVEYGCAAAFVRALGRRGPVAYVLGNHEMYGASGPDQEDLVAAALGRINAPAVRVLRRDEMRVGSVRVLGATLYWSEPALPHLTGCMMDYRQVDRFVPWVYEQGAADEGFLRMRVGEGDVVVTHLMPSQACVNKRYQNNALNHFFVRDMDDLITAARPAVWCSGHTHDGYDLTLGATRLLCNPRGYPDERQDRPFDPVLEFEV